MRRVSKNILILVSQNTINYCVTRNPDLPCNLELRAQDFQL